MIAAIEDESLFSRMVKECGSSAHTIVFGSLSKRERNATVGLGFSDAADALRKNREKPGSPHYLFTILRFN
jgi:hypothetical protein